ncbi:MAG: periplasmic heavy metal sensor [Bacteroidota bacterium]|nr:periplasmic heavy metal sensor [Bacteroidota bacterium]
MKKYLVVFLTVALSAVCFAQPETAVKKNRAMNMPMREAFFAKLNLTDQQKEALKNLRYETAKKAINLRAKLAESRLDLAKLLGSDSPDQAAIEKQMNEVAANETAVKANRLNAWFEANKQLTPEQQKIWRQVLRRSVRQHAERGVMRMHGMMERGRMMQMGERMDDSGMGPESMGMGGAPGMDDPIGTDMDAPLQ